MGTVTSTAALGTLNMIASSIGQNFLWGKICDRYRVRAKLIIAGETIAAFTYIAVYLVHRSLIDTGSTFTAGLSLIFGLSVLEFFWSMSDVGWAALLTDVTTPQIRGSVIGTLNFIASLGRMFGILFAGTLYFNGDGFRNGTIFYIVTFLLLVGSAIMTLLSRHMKKGSCQQEQPKPSKTDDSGTALLPQSARSYRWFLLSLIVIVLGAASINQIFLLFLSLPSPGLAALDPDVGIILSAWTVGGMLASLTSGRLTDKIGRTKVMFLGLGMTAITPVLYAIASSVPTMALVYGLNGVAFWTIQTVGFVLAGDIIPEQRRGRLLSRYNTVIALSWGPAGILIGGPLADIQVKVFGLTSHAAYVNTFYVSSLIVAVGAILFALRFVKTKP
jgi:MFS family permease